MEILSNRVALVTGGMDEVGEAIGLRLGKLGAKIVSIDIDKSKVDGVVSRIKEAGAEAIGLVADPSKPEEAEKAVGEVLKKFGKIDILLNNVSDQEWAEISMLSDEEWHNSLRANLDAVFFFCRSVVPGMRERKYGRIINMGDLTYLGWPGRSNYCAAKSALFGFTRSLALELAKDGITVNQVVKGDVSESGLTEDEVAKVASGLPVQKIGNPKDVARAVGFLASDTSGYVTGQTLFVCGGKSLHFSMSV